MTGRGKRRSRRGQELVEFSLVFITVLGLLFTLFDLNYALFCRATLHHAVREGVRFAITGRTLSGLSHDASIREVVKRNSLTLLSSAANQAKIKIRYYQPDGATATANNAAGNIVVVAVEGYQVKPIAPVMRTSASFNLNASALDKMEPFPGAPPAR